MFYETIFEHFEEEEAIYIPLNETKQYEVIYNAGHSSHYLQSTATFSIPFKADNSDN